MDLLGVGCSNDNYELLLYRIFINLVLFFFFGFEIDKWNRIIIFFFDKRNKSLDEIFLNLFYDFL